MSDLKIFAAKHSYLGKRSKSSSDPVACIDELRKVSCQIFPFVEAYLLNHHLSMEGKTNEEISTMGKKTVPGFLRLLKRWRTTMIQDSLQFMEICPQLSMWKHPSFSTQEYKQWSLEAHGKLLKMVEDPAIERLMENDRMYLLHDDHQSISSDIARIERPLTWIQDSMDNLVVRYRDSSACTPVSSQSVLATVGTSPEQGDQSVTTASVVIPEPSFPQDIHLMLKEPLY